MTLAQGGVELMRCAQRLLQLAQQDYMIDGHYLATGMDLSRMARLLILVAEKIEAMPREKESAHGSTRPPAVRRNLGAGAVSRDGSRDADAEF